MYSAVLVLSNSHECFKELSVETRKKMFLTAERQMLNGRDNILAVFLLI